MSEDVVCLLIVFLSLLGLTLWVYLTTPNEPSQRELLNEWLEERRRDE